MKWEKILANHTFNKGLMLKMHKEFKLFNNKRINTGPGDRRHANDQGVHKMLNVSSYQGNATQNHN